MILDEILYGYEYEKIKGDMNIHITQVVNDSRKVSPGDLFLAEEGYRVDGHDYIQKAIDLGAVAIIVEKDIELDEEVTLIKVENSADALAYSLARLNGNPWEKLSLTGITGTNGKTSTTYFIKSILDEMKIKSGIIGTMGSIIDARKIDVDNTTPNSFVIHELLNEMISKSVDHCIMEVSSHALSLKRVEYMEFETGIFTNLAKDHLDYHKTVENYFESKLELFKKTRKNNIINIDDEYGKEIVDRLGNRVGLITFGIREKADIYAENIKYSLSKVNFDLCWENKRENISLNVPGEFSVYNALAAAAFAYSYGIDMESVKNGLEAVEGVKGRFEVVPTNTDYTVIIDFAHTAEGLEQVLKVIDEFAEGRKIVLFGAGGNRDKSKRPEMGQVVGKHADLSIVTSDNPRHEDASRIIKDIIVGTKKETNNYKEIVDRIEAIHYALDIADKGDVILLAGKGHETYTIIGDKTIACDERQIVLDYLSHKQNQ